MSSVSEDGRFAVLAVDHRDSLRRFLAPDDPDGLSGAEITDLKQLLVDGLASLATGVMLEPEYSIPQVSDRLPPTVGFFAALEAQGYLGQPGTKPTTILDGWSVEAAAVSGAAVAKLLLPYRPDRPLAADQLALAKQVVADGHRSGIPVVLEPLFYDLADPRDRLDMVLRTAEDFAAVGPQLLKLPFPVDPSLVTETAERVEACQKVSDRCPMPWALLSGGGSFGSFLDQVSDATAGGCSGFMVGRALWGDAVTAPAPQRQELIETQVRARFIALRAAVGLPPVSGLG
ncbi:MAG: hypothetical protein GY773_28760 [Actinomycetia bacterium]|nr:hypothetical protein [Actinomycetes bacterium]